MPDPRRKTIYHMPLEVAVFCPDCKEVSNGKHACPACASVNIASLATWIDRDKDASREARLERALLFLQAYFQKLEDDTDDSDPLKQIRRRYHAPLHQAIEEGLRP